MQKLLEDTNLKLASVATDSTGVSARTLLQALLSGQTDPEALAQLARGRLRKKLPQLAQAFVGTLKAHHRLLLTSQLAQLDFLDEQIVQFDQEIAQRLGLDEGASEEDQSASPSVPQGEARPGRTRWAEAVHRLDAVPGVNQRIGSDRRGGDWY